MAITKQQWYEHGDFRRELEELLRHPTLQIALDMVQEQGLRATITPSNTDLVQFFALMGAKKDGYLEALTNLRDLAQTQKTPPPMREPWANASSTGTTPV